MRVGCSLLKEKSEHDVLSHSAVTVHHTTAEMLTGNANPTRLGQVIWQPLNQYPSLRRVHDRNKSNPFRRKCCGTRPHNKSRWRRREVSEVGQIFWSDPADLLRSDYLAVCIVRGYFEDICVTLEKAISCVFWFGSFWVE